MNAAIAWRGVVKRFGRLRALDGLTLEVPPGSITGLVGSNGAGKTTAFSVAAGLTRPDAGSVEVFGSAAFDPHRHAGRLTILPQDSELPRDSRPRETLAFYAALQGLDRSTAWREADRLLSLVHMTERARSPLRTLSHGMRKRIMIAQCFLGMPEIVLLDEPMSGLDPREVARIREFLLSQRRRRTIVISSHNLHEIELMCDHVAFIERGRAVRSGPIEVIASRRGLAVFVLGAGAEPPLQNLEAAMEGATFGFDGESGELTCRYDADRFTPDAVHARVLRILLDAGSPVLEVHRGRRLESEYLRQTS